PSTTIHSLFPNDTPPPQIYTLSLHDALPISVITKVGFGPAGASTRACAEGAAPVAARTRTSASSRRIDGTPKPRQAAPGTRPRLANRVTSSPFLYRMVTGFP